MATKKTQKKISTPIPSGISFTRSGRSLLVKWSKPAQEKVARQVVEVIYVNAANKEWVVSVHKLSKAATSLTVTIPKGLVDVNPAQLVWMNIKTPLKAIKVRITNVGLSNSTGDKQTTQTYSIAAPKKPVIEYVLDETTAGFKVMASDDGKAVFGELSVVYYYRERGGAIKEYTHKSASKVYGPITNISTLNPLNAHVLKVTATVSGPGGNAEATLTRYVSKPKDPGSLGVKRLATGSYRVSWAYDPATWWPVDRFEVRYIDVPQNDSTIRDYGSWSVARGDIDPKTRAVQTDLLPGIQEGYMRRFMVVAWHNGAHSEKTASYIDYGAIPAVSEVSIAPVQNTTKQVGSWVWPTNVPAAAKMQVFVDNATKPVKTISSHTTSSYTTGNLGSGAHRIGARIYLDSTHYSKTVWSVWSSSVSFEIKNLRATVRADNESVDLNWTNVGTQNGATGIAAAWSEWSDAFISNKQPEIAEIEENQFLDADSASHVVIRGLEKGKKLYFWARKFMKDGSLTTYGKWQAASCAGLRSDEEESDANPAVMATPIESVSLALARTWARQGDSSVRAQIAWVAAEGMDPTASYVTLYDGERAVRTWPLDLSGWGSLTLQGVPAGSYSVRAYAANAAGVTASDELPLSIVAKPACALSTDSLAIATTVTEGAEGEPVTVREATLRQPGLMFACSGTEGAELTLSIIAQQAYEAQMPYGAERLYEGEVVWSGSLAGDGEIDASSAQLLDGAVYVARLVSTDPVSGLSSEPSEVTFRVDWERKATAPVASVTSMPDLLGVRVRPTLPQDAEEGDACDIYRVTRDGAQLVRAGAEWGEPSFDAYSPFSWDGCAYLVACRTPYGSIAWEEYDYGLDCDAIRIDWPGGSVELPYGITIGDSRSKDYEVRSYLGGQRRAFVKPALSRKQTLSASLLVPQDDRRLDAIYALSRYMGTCMVRTPDGSAYVAVVDVSMNWSGGNAPVSVSIDATETDANGDYMMESEGD